MMELTTETLLYLAGNLFRIYVIYRFFRIFFGESQFSQKITVTVFFIYFAVNSGIFLLFSMPLVNLCTNLLLTLALTLLYQEVWYMRLLATVMIYAVNLFCESIIYRVLLIFLDTNNIAIGIIAPNLFMLPLVLSLGKWVDFKGGKSVSLEEWWCALFVPIISICISVVVLHQNPNNISAVMGMMGLLVINVLIFNLFDRVVKANSQKMELVLQKQQTEAYEYQLQILKQSEKNMASFRHDFQNHMIALQDMVGRKDVARLQVYLDGMMTFTRVQGRHVESGNTTIDSILNWKLSEVKNLGGEWKTDVNVPQELQISMMDLNIILSNLLDNAIQAMRLCKKKKLKISIVFDRGTLFIEIQNTYTGSIKKVNGHLLTTKKEKAGHGIGLANVRRVAEKYGGELELHYDEDLFTANVLLYLLK